MISYPFFWDQPGLARKCQQFGVAVPLADTPRGAIGRADVDAAMERVLASREAMRKALEEAHGWERAVMANRSSVLRRISEF